MANIIDFSKDTKTINSSTSSIPSETQTTKNKPSLFDSLLTNNQTEETIETIDVNKKEVLKTQENKSVEIIQTQETVETLDVDKKEEVKSTSSLLDRLILEAKKDVKTISEEEIKSLDIKASVLGSVIVDEVEIKTPNLEVIQTEETIETIDVNKKEVLKTQENKSVEIIQTQETVETLDVDKKEEVKSTSSLLDRLILEAKKDVKTISEEEIKSLDIKASVLGSVIVDEVEIKTPNLEVIQTEETIETIDVNKKEVLKTQENKSVEIIQTQETVETLDVDKKEEVKSTSSLLDRLILEAKKDVKTISEEEIKSLDIKASVLGSVIVDEVKIKTPNLEVIQTEETIETIDVNKKEVLKTQENKSVEIIQTQETVETLDVDKKEEVKSTSSLLDRLILEAKKDVKTISEEEIKSLDIKASVLGSVIVDEVEIKTPNLEVIQTEETIETIDVNKKEVLKTDVKNQILEPVVILANNITKDETKNSSLNANVDVKLNVLSEVVSSTADVKISLMDQLIQKNIENNKTIISSEQINLVQKENISKDLISNIYLGTQKNSISNQELFNKNEAINLLKDANSLNDVKTSAGMLELGLENINIDLEQSLDLTTKTDINKKIDLDLVTRRNLIDNLILQKNVTNEDIKGLITKSVEASSALLENNLKLAEDAIITVNSPLSYNIQSKIIGAKQQMSTMMSDIARQMYENYKPPVTVFKINLNPLELGSIAILMKSDKNNALSISMNVSNNSTLDALVENQNVLRNSLNKTFDENTKFNLDFSSSNQNNNQSSNQNNQNNQNRFEQQMDTQSVLQLKEENKDREEKSIDYM